MAVTTAATFCATLVDEWIRCGVDHAVVAPGSRSTPLALALTARREITVHVFHDERSASFAAIGLGLATGRPAVLLCTSGTAAAELHAAVVEAHQAEVPVIVCTADRPPELREVSAPQTIDQVGLYGRSVRWSFDPGVPDDDIRHTWRSLACRAFADASGPWPGPVHLNLAFRDPLVGDPGELPPGRPVGAPWRRSLGAPACLAAAQLAVLAAALDEQRGVIVAGGGAGEAPAVTELAAALSWPVLADPRSGCRVEADTTIAAFDELVRHPAFAADHAPTVVLRLGDAPASKVLDQWIAASGAREVQVRATPRHIDAGHRVALDVVADPTLLCRALAPLVKGASGTPWLARWRRAEERVQQAVTEVLAAQPAPTEPAVARGLLAALPAGAALVVSSSMPVRDLEWYGEAGAEVEVFSNRGANGIDGVVSTAVGVALADPDRPVALLIGDVAFLHDSNGLLGLARRAVNLTLVVVDNDGGGIFSFLPQAGAVELERFEQLWGTPHGVGIPGLAGIHSIESWSIEHMADLAPATARAAAGRGVTLLHVRTERSANVALHDVIHRAVAVAVLLLEVMSDVRHDLSVSGMIECFHTEDL